MERTPSMSELNEVMYGQVCFGLRFFDLASAIVKSEAVI